jgi:hypothetical protein
MFLVNHSKHLWPFFSRGKCEEELSFSRLGLLICGSVGSFRDICPDDTADPDNRAGPEVSQRRTDLDQGYVGAADSVKLAA